MLQCRCMKAALLLAICVQPVIKPDVSASDQGRCAKSGNQSGSCPCARGSTQACCPCLLWHLWLRLLKKWLAKPSDATKQAEVGQTY